LSELIEGLIFDIPLPAGLKASIAHLRDRAISEVRPGSGQMDIKIGRGGIADIESVVHYLTLVHGQARKELRCRRISNALSALFKEGRLSPDDHTVLSEAHIFYKRLLARTRLFTKRTSNIIDMNAETTTAVALSLGYKDKDELQGYMQRLMTNVRDIYTRTILG
jgi:glutamate-ammonia-ligase adenylyltransferase